MVRQTVWINNNFVHKFLTRCKERCRSEGKVANNMDLITDATENADQMSVKMSIVAKHFLDICFKDTRTSHSISFLTGIHIDPCFCMSLKTASGHLFLM